MDAVKVIRRESEEPDEDADEEVDILEQATAPEKE